MKTRQIGIEELEVIEMHKKPKHAELAIAILTIMTLLSSSAVKADPVTGLNTFVTGQPATAASVNDNFTEVETSVNDNDTRITNNTANIADNFSSITTNTADISANFNNLDQRLANFETDLSGYGMSFSADGATKNVTVTSWPAGGGGTNYSIRSRYESSTEQISIDGILTFRPFIANYAFVQTDIVGDVIQISNYIEAPDTASYQSYNIEESTFDVGTLEKTVTADTLRETFTCSGNFVFVCFGYQTLNLDGSFFNLYDFSRNRQLAGPITLNGLTFDDVRLESSTGNTSQFRIRARGIGEVFRRTRSSTGTVQTRTVIYYQANGISGGSLAGTPFDTGQLLEGLFF